MKEYPGKSINAGSVIGKVIVLTGECKEDKVDRCENAEASDIESEICRLKEAVSSAIAGLNMSMNKAQNSGIQSTADIINTHIMMLEDDSADSIILKTESVIRNDSIKAEYALEKAAGDITESLSKSSSEYIKARSEDILYLKKMLLNNLAGREDRDIRFDEPSILIAEELSPETLISVDPNKLLGIVTTKGSPLSHTSIVARNMDKPYLSGVEWDVHEVQSGMMGAIDGQKKTFILEPDEETVSGLSKQIEDEKTLSDEDALRLIDESRVKLYANIGSVQEAETAKQKGAKGIGLFRTEFLYMDRDDVPSEDEQYKAYSEVASVMEGMPVIIRTIDIGADKNVRCLPVNKENAKKEDNPALGTRGIRISFEYPELFKAQLRAILRASTAGNLGVMFPMIANEWEIKKAKEMLYEAATELEAEGVPFSYPEIGIMVETPAAAVNIENIAPMVDFVSIGTNDLTQYTLGLDRMNDTLSDYYDAHHPAVMSLIQMTVRGAHKAGIKTGICGELAADDTLSVEFAKMGIDELSMTPAKLKSVAKAISEAGINDINLEKIAAPVSGELVRMEEIPDDTFAEGLLGPCIGILPDNGVIYSPVSGHIVSVAPTGHAFSIKTDSGMEVLVHVGIDTVTMNGDGFDCKLSEGQKVSVQEELMTFDPGKVKAAGLSPMVIVVKIDASSDN